MAFEPKRFWDHATAQQVGSGFAIMLDQRALKTPLKNPVIVPSKGFADKITAEWAMVEGKINKYTMPFTRFAEAALDAAAPEYQELVENLTAYGESDLLCYRAESPHELVKRQADHWDDMLAWGAQKFDAPLHQTNGIIAIKQPQNSVENLRQQVKKFDLFQLTAFYDLVKISGSLLLALAVAHKHLNPKTAWQLSRLDEDWQIEQWGSDDEATQLAESRCQDFENAALALALLTN